MLAPVPQSQGHYYRLNYKFLGLRRYYRYHQEVRSIKLIFLWCNLISFLVVEQYLQMGLLAHHHQVFQEYLYLYLELIRLILK